MLTQTINSGTDRNRSHQKKYDEAFKREALKKWTDSGDSLAASAVKQALHPSILARWNNELKAAKDAEVAQLREEKAALQSMLPRKRGPGRPRGSFTKRPIAQQSLPPLAAPDQKPFNRDVEFQQLGQEVVKLREENAALIKTIHIITRQSFS